MGLLDNLRKLFGNQPDTTPVQKNMNNSLVNKKDLIDDIVDLVEKLKRINSFDSNLWNLSNSSINYTLNSKSIEELNQLKLNLRNRIDYLQNQNRTSTSSSVEAAKWTGNRTPGMSSHDLDFSQRDDGR